MIRRVAPVARQGRPQVQDRPPVFDGYPYLVIRFGHVIRHLAVLPVDWPRERLVALAVRQAAANGLGTCVCLGPADLVYVTPKGLSAASAHAPLGIPVVGRLLLVEAIDEAAELRRRRGALEGWAKRHRGSGYLVGDGLEGGRPATPGEGARLSPTPADLHPGLRPCPACHGLRGEFLAVRGEGTGDLTPRVLNVLCPCDNVNRCAGCGATLADQPLSAWSWDEEAQKVRYLAAYAGLNHRCAESPGIAREP